MIDQSVCQSASTRVLATEDLSRPNCPDCGSVLLIAEESRFNLRGRIDHAHDISFPLIVKPVSEDGSIGISADAVVDSELRVHGLRGLRVADASVMPSIISAPTNAPSFMIGGRAAELIKASR